MSHLFNELLLHIRAEGLPEPVTEYRFHKTRRWRFDACWPDLKLAVEVEGGAWINGRHNRGSGFEADLEKYGEAMALGWTVYRCGRKLIKSGDAIRTILILYEQRQEATA